MFLTRCCDQARGKPQDWWGPSHVTVEVVAPLCAVLDEMVLLIPQAQDRPDSFCCLLLLLGASILLRWRLWSVLLPLVLSLCCGGSGQ